MSTSKEPTPYDWNTRLVNWFIRNTQLVLLVFISLVIGGIFSLFNLRSEGFPNPDINIAIITSSYPGASAAEVEQQITKPLELAVQSVRGIDQITSSSESGFTTVSAQFLAGTDFNSALSELRTKVQNAQLPQDADKPTVMVPSIGGNQSYFAVVGDKDAAPASLRSAGEQVRLAVEALSDVKEFKLVSDLKDQVEVRWRSADIAKLGLTPVQIQQALAGNNITIPAGTIDLENRQATVVSSAPFQNLADLEQTVIGVNNSTVPPKPVHLKDVATVASTVASDDIIQKVGTHLDGPTLSTRSAIIYQLTLKANADILKSESKISEAINGVANDSSKVGTAKVLTVFNAAEQVRGQVKEIKEGAVGGPIGTGPLKNAGYALGGIWLVVLVMLIFVNWRVALISALVIPLALLFTVLSLKIMGITLNTLTLFSMILVLGLVVDPAIVVLEAIQREVDFGKRGLDAVLAAASSIGNGVFMAVLTSVIVFLPFGVVSGLFGQIIRYIPLTVIPALIASYFVPLLFLTYLAQRFLKPHQGAVQDEIKNLWSVGRWFITTNRRILNSKPLQIMIIVLAVIIPLGISGYLFAAKKITPVQFSSTRDSERIDISVSFPANLDKASAVSLINKLDPVLEKESVVDNYFVETQSKSSVMLVINLVRRADRSEDSTNIVNRLKETLKSFDNADLHEYYTVATAQIGPPGQDYPVAVNIYGDNLDDLKKAAIKTGQLLRDQPNVTRVEDGFTGVVNPQIEVSLDRQKLSAKGLVAIQVAQVLGGHLGRASVTKFDQKIDGLVRSNEVILVNADQPSTIEAIQNILVGTSNSLPVKVGDIATVTNQQGFTSINRLNGSRYVTIQAQVKDALKDAAVPQKAVKDFWTKDTLAEYNLRADALQDKGSGDAFKKSFTDLFIALAVAILLTYIVLVLFFQSFSQPFIILFAVPLSFIGVFPALALIGGQFGFLEILGVITLVGIVENVGIFVIDLANRKRKEGVEYREAIAESTGIRFRPIFLTKVTALGGLLPLMILSPFWRSLAVVVVAGILTSGILSLFTTPILYAWFLEFKGWVYRMFSYVKPNVKK